MACIPAAVAPPTYVHRIVADVEAALRRNAQPLRRAMKQLGGRFVHAFFARHEHHVDLRLEIESLQFRAVEILIGRS
jgi:hypothetical protein